MRDGQFYNGDTYTLYVPVNNTDPKKGQIHAGKKGTEFLEIRSGNLPPGITLPLDKFVGSPTTVGTYTFVVHGKGYPGCTNLRGESTVDVTVTYVVTPN